MLPGQDDKCLTKSRELSTNSASTQARSLHDDNDNDLFANIFTQLSSMVPNTRQQQETTTDSTSIIPAYISSIFFIEFDTSGELNIINENDSFLSTNLTSGQEFSFDSIAQQLDTTQELQDQMDLVPGGAGLFIIGSNEDGEAVVSARMVWEFTPGECEVVPVLVGESLGMVEFVSVCFCKIAICWCRVG